MGIFLKAARQHSRVRKLEGPTIPSNRRVQQEDFDFRKRNPFLRPALIPRAQLWQGKDQSFPTPTELADTSPSLLNRNSEESRRVSRYGNVLV
jgi:hypothetical protein